jgi:hypothetical protein
MSTFQCLTPLIAKPNQQENRLFLANVTTPNFLMKLNQNGVPDPRVKLHCLHPPPLPTQEKGSKCRSLTPAQPNQSAASVRDYCSGFYTICNKTEWHDKFASKRLKISASMDSSNLRANNPGLAIRYSASWDVKSLGRNFIVPIGIQSIVLLSSFTIVPL